MNVETCLDAIAVAELARYEGVVTHISPSSIEADGPFAKIGAYCAIESGADSEPLLAEIVSLDKGRIRLSPLHSTRAIQLGARVWPTRHMDDVAYGDALCGRAINALGQPIDARGPIYPAGYGAREGTIPKTLDRESPSRKLTTGIRAIDALFPIGEGQRIGIFAASGVGKTSLVEQLSRQMDCDHCILCLVGERGREVEKLWSMHLAGEDRARFTIVAATSDESASMRVRAVDQALGLAEYWRGQGRHVVVFVDSVTRLALAQRELGFAAGEPPTVRAFTPNVFTAMPRIVERCGADRNGGSITAIFTVLSETDDVDDPIVELMKSLLDGHIILSRTLADKGHFPAIDIGASVSRMTGTLLDKQGARMAKDVHRSFADYHEARPMVESGIYRAGSNAGIDRAVALAPRLLDFLQQGADEYSAQDTTRAALARLFDGSGL